MVFLFFVMLLMVLIVAFYSCVGGFSGSVSADGCVCYSVLVGSL